MIKFGRKNRHREITYARLYHRKGRIEPVKAFDKNNTVTIPYTFILQYDDLARQLDKLEDNILQYLEDTGQPKLVLNERPIRIEG